MTTYAIRCQPYADDDSRWYVFTITAEGYRHIFASGAECGCTRFAAALNALPANAIAILCGDLHAGNAEGVQS